MKLRTLTFKTGHSLEIHADECADSPREWGNLGTMVCFHSRYNLGDKHSYEGSPKEVKQHILEEYPDCVIFPLYLYDHSGLRISVAPFSCPWDSGQVGFIFVSLDRIKQEYGDLNLNEAIKRAEDCLRGEVEVYDQYLSNDVWAFVLRDPPCEKCGAPGEETDCVGGFYGDDPIKNGMIDCLDEMFRQALRSGDFTTTEG